MSQSEVGRDLLAAVRRASKDEHFSFDGSPRAANASGSVVFVEPRTTTGEFGGTAVVRFCPDIKVAKREAAIQQFVNDRGFPAPAVLLSGSADDELEGAWLLTGHVSGLAVRIGQWQRPISGLKSLLAMWRRPSLLADLVVWLHSIDPGPLASTLEEAAVSFDWYRYQWDLAQQLRGEDIGELIDWLKANRPLDSEAVVSHGDLHPGNIVVGPDGPHVVDWGIAGLAPAARDVACTMFALLNTGGQAPAQIRPIFSVLGKVLSRRFLRLYRRRSPAPMTDEELDWHRVLYSVNRIFWISNEEGTGPAANDDHALAKRAAGRTAGALGQEISLNVELIEDITGIEIGV